MHDLIKRNAPRGVSEDTAWRLILQSALGLAHIHGLKILHRDVKSENIFLDAKGDAKIGDLGVAKSLKNTNDLGVTLVGTPFYLSPELCDRRPYDAKSDVWSLGVVLYELLTGKPPFRARSQQELFLKILDGSYAPLPEKERGSSSGVSRDMRLLVRDMLETNVSRRVDAAGVATRPASVAKARALGVDGVFEALNIDGTVDDATQRAVRGTNDSEALRKNVKNADRPRTAAASRGLRLGIYTTDARGNPRPSTTRAGLRAEALAEAERLARENESRSREPFSLREDETSNVSPSGKRDDSDPDPARNGNGNGNERRKDWELFVAGRSPAIAAGIAAAAAGGGAAGEAAAARHLTASPRFVTNDPVAAAAAATAAQARAARQRAIEQASEARRERERARERERQERRDANEEAAARQRRKVADAAEASAAARARLASARARRVALSRGVGGSPTRIGHAAVSASRPETACAFSSDRPDRGPASGREAAMAAAGRSRAHSARPSRPNASEGEEYSSARLLAAEARDAAAAVAALPEHHHVASGFFAHGPKAAFEQGVEDAKLASRRVDAMRDGGYFAQNPARNHSARPSTAAGCFRVPKHPEGGEHSRECEDGKRSEYSAPVRPLWPSRPSTAAARVGPGELSGAVSGFGQKKGAPFVRPSSAAALRRAAALCAEIENGSDTNGSDAVSAKGNKPAALLAVDTALAPLSDVEESPAGAYAAASPSSWFAPVGGDETFASSTKGYPYGGRLTVAPTTADETCGETPSDADAFSGALDDGGDAFERALRLCHSAAETAAGVAERLRAREPPEGDGSRARTVAEDDGGVAAESEEDLNASEMQDEFIQHETRSGDENDVPSPSVFPNARDAVAIASSSPPRSPSRPGSAFGERSVRSSLERFQRRRSATCFEPRVLTPSRPLTLNHCEKDDSEEEDGAVVEEILEALLLSAELCSVVETSGAEEDEPVEKTVASVHESERDAADDDDERAARVEALVAEMSKTESSGSALIGAEAFGGLYDALARRAEAAAAAAAAMHLSSDGFNRAPFGTEEERESESESDERSFDSSDAESDGSGCSRWTPTKRNVFSEKNARDETWSATLGPFASSVTVAMTPRREKDGTKKKAKRRRDGDDVTLRFAQAEVLALRYARLVSELEKVGRSREGTPEGDNRDCALGLAAGGPTGK